MEKKYAVYPGGVISRTDGDHHYVGARELMRLYDVDPRECVVVQSPEVRKHPRVKGLIKLAPRYDGDYSLPEEA